ncbi:MAG: PAS domain-containing protein [Rhodobacteraceae bacterium]|nr:MAG: PAS domain-containing protein [Paracoccaceae bacterium]
MSPRDNKTGVSQDTGHAKGAADVVPLSEKLRAKWGQPLQQVEAYWQAMRAGRNVPARSEIDPRGIESALEYAFIAERIAPTHARIRIGGTHLCDLMGMEVRGMPLSALLVPVSRERLATCLREAFDSPARVELTLQAEKRLGRPGLSGRMLLLPLTDDFGDVSRVLGCLVSDGPIGRAPRRFEVVQADVSPMRAPPRVTVPQPAPPRQAAGFAEPQAGFRPGPVPYLRLIKTDD